MRVSRPCFILRGSPVAICSSAVAILTKIAGSTAIRKRRGRVGSRHRVACSSFLHVDRCLLGFLASPSGEGLPSTEPHAHPA